ncbi:MAG: triose-phosphate isomerase [Elusimicrobiota bacterium]|jgi:triosephosphate isomerase|nr:triose-phosphate isomerase [Elusimicrobiota bacterium]
MRKPIMAGNWKMNKTISEAVDFCKTLKKSVEGVSDVEILICPAFTALAAAYNEVKGSNINVGAQNLFWESKGAFTGEVSPLMIKDSGCSYVLVGHSERRQFFGETDSSVNKKTKAAFAAGLIPVVCIGETLAQRENNETLKVIETQIKGGLANLTPQEADTVVIAYEPVWAIGTGKTATPEQAQGVHAFARKIYAQIYQDAADKVRILYGGSVKPDNVSALMQKPDIDGGLVGGASLEADSFAKLVKYSK